MLHVFHEIRIPPPLSLSPEWIVQSIVSVWTSVKGHDRLFT